MMAFFIKFPHPSIRPLDYSGCGNNVEITVGERPALDELTLIFNDLFYDSFIVNIKVYKILTLGLIIQIDGFSIYDIIGNDFFAVNIKYR
jgi:hypothetical protein